MRLALLLLVLLSHESTGLIYGERRGQEEKKHFDPAVHEATKTFSHDEFLVIPVRVHVMQCKEEAALQCRLKEADIRRVFGKVNRIWNKAGLAMSVESIVTEEARRPEGFDAARLDHYKETRAETGRDAGMIHVYYVHQLPTNGVFMGRDAIFVKDTAALREVKGGVDEPIPRVTSHEIGHALGLPHRQDTLNLMASGTTGWSINDDEIGRVRGWASKQEWILTSKVALEKGHAAVIAELPGDSELKEKAKSAIRKP